MRTKTSTIVITLDMNPLYELAMKKLKEDGVKGVVGVSGRFTHGIIKIGKDVYALDSDGCGNTKPISDEYTYNIGIYGEYKRDGEMLEDMFPTKVFKLNAKQLKHLATGKKVNLAKFIRPFGHRLEYNYETWRKDIEHAKSIMKQKKRGVPS